MLTHYKKYINDSEIDIILNYIKTDLYWFLVFSIMAYMGLRSVEVATIKKQDILGDCDKIRLRLAKSNRIHERVIPDKIRPWLRLFLQDHGCEYLFYSKYNDHLQTASIRWKLKYIRHKLNLSDKYYKRFERISCHAFRHYFVTRAYRLSGYDLVATKEIIGHVKIETTEKYITHEEKERKIAKII